MTHSYIQESDVAERYLLGQLSDQERSSFEEHLVDCPECLDRVEMAERFRRGLRTAVVEDAASTAFLMPTGLLARLALFSRRQQRTLLASVVLLLIVVAIVTYFAGVKRAEMGQDQLKASYAGLQREHAQQLQAQRKLEERLQASEAQRQQLETLLARERQTQPSASLVSSASLPVFTLSMVRSTDINRAPANTVSISQSASGVVLLLDLEPDPAVVSYRATLSTVGKTVWQALNLESTGKDTIALVLGRALLPPGSYVLALEGCTQQHRCYPAGSYTFRAAARD